MPVKDQLHLAFGESLKAWRQQRGFSQEELASDAELSPSFVGMLERGEKTTTLLQIGKLADALSIEVKDLFLGTEESPHIFREAEILFRKIVSEATQLELKFFVAFCEIFAAHISRREK